MAEFVEVMSKQELSSGQMKMVKVAGHEILLARGGDLSQGKLEKTIITCPKHHSRFDLVDGHVVRWTDWTGLLLNLGKIARSPRPLKTHRVKVEGDKVLVETGTVPASV